VSTPSAIAIHAAERARLSHERAADQLARAERRAEAAVGGAFLVAVAALFLIRTPHTGFSVVASLSCVAILAVASRVTFDVGAGFTVPTQIPFVPLVLLTPPALIAPLTVLALVLGMLPDVIVRRLPPSRLLVVPGNSWFAIGPAALMTVPHDGVLPPIWLLVALIVAQFAGDLAANALRERLQHRIRLGELLLEERLVFVVDLALFPVGLATALATQVRPWAVLLVAPLIGLLSVFSRERRARLDQLVELNNAYRGTALVLGDVVEADDGYTGEHSRGVVSLAIDVGSVLGLDPGRRRNLEFGALLHDVGKIAIPKEIINKPGKLDPAEWTIVKTHTLEGQRMLDRVGGFMRDVGLIVRSHHERWDGSGYPDGLAGEAIPLEARIIACCDAWNAMTTTRSYRAAMPAAAAAAELRACAGTQFDPRVVDAVLGLVLGSAAG
jgi:HD-GYP domain-containing protein (c-di-GMP phosphodiesterase class II)